MYTCIHYFVPVPFISSILLMIRSSCIFFQKVRMENAPWWCELACPAARQLSWDREGVRYNIFSVGSQNRVVWFVSHEWMRFFSRDVSSWHARKYDQGPADETLYWKLWNTETFLVGLVQSLYWFSSYTVILDFELITYQFIFICLALFCCPLVFVNKKHVFLATPKILIGWFMLSYISFMIQLI